MVYCHDCREKFGWPSGKNTSLGVCDMCGVNDLCHTVASRHAYPPKYSHPELLPLYEQAKQKEK